MRYVVLLIAFTFFVSFALAQFLTEGLLRLFDAHKFKLRSTP